MNRFAKAQAGTGAALGLLGVTVMAGWLLRNAAMVQILPNSIGMVFNAALCFTLLGCALLLPALKPGWTRAVQTAIGGGLLAVALAVLAEHVADAGFGIDFPSLHQWLRDPQPGRMALGACIGFALCGLALVLMPRVTTKTHGALVQIASFSAFIAGLVGSLAYSLDLGLLYSDVQSPALSPPAAAGLMLGAVGLWLCWYPSDWYRSRRYFEAGEKRGFIGIAILVVAALAIGGALFSTQQRAIEQASAGRMSALLNSRTALFLDVLERSRINSESMAAAPDLIRLMRLLRANPDNQDALIELHDVGNSLLLAADVAGATVYDANKREVMEFGRIADAPEMIAHLPGAAPAVLFWNDALYVNRQLPIADRNETIGYLVVEQALPLLAKQSPKMDGLGQSGQISACAPGTEQFLCFPLQRDAAVFRSARRSPAGAPLPMNDALAGRSGVFHGPDHRGRDVIAVYGPVGGSGLGAVAKQDSEELYRPVRQQLELAAQLLLLLAALLAGLLQAYVRFRHKVARDALRAAQAGLEDRVRERTTELLQQNDLLQQEIAERKRAEEALMQSQDELRKMAAQQDYMKEQERRQIAREIHDELGGALTGIRSYLSFIVDEAGRSATRPDRHVLEARNLTDSAIETARRVSSELRPSVLDQLGLWAALEWHAEQIEQSTGLKCSVAVDAQVARISLDPERSTALFRIVQQALDNIVRHGQASRVAIRAVCENDAIVIEVHDDGAVTEPQGFAARGSRGVAGMVERTRHLGGDLDINRAAEGGTVVVLRIPIGETNER